MKTLNMIFDKLVVVFHKTPKPRPNKKLTIRFSVLDTEKGYVVVEPSVIYPDGFTKVFDIQSLSTGSMLDLTFDVEIKEW